MPEHKCSNCGGIIESNSNLCPYCGDKVIDNTFEKT